MSNYQFTPGPPQRNQEYSYLTWENAFTSEELDKIVEIGENLVRNRASVGGGNTDEIDHIRKSEVSWIKYDDADWVYDRLAFVCRRLNSEYYQFDLHGFVEDFQFTIYYGDENGHYDWHIDRNASNIGSPRKLSLVLQLSDPTDYEGGSLEIWSANQPDAVKKERGYIAAFPSYVLHRVTPVTKGIRRSLVVWVAGPQFK
jgi:PKHD-type hydroxylase